MTILGRPPTSLAVDDYNETVYQSASLGHKAKQQLANRFSKAAKQYQQKAEVQSRIADHLLKLIAADGYHKPKSMWLDLGCGSGYLLEKLAQTNNEDRFLGIDIAHGMLLEAQKMQSGYVLNADAELMPLRTGIIDHVISSMALQWVSSPQRVMAEIARVLGVNGQVSLAILREDSLPELHLGWQYLGQGNRANKFASRGAWLQGIEQAGLKVKQVKQQTFLTQHNNLSDLLYSIKGIGAGTTITKTTQPLRRTDLKNLEQWWQREHLINNSLTLTYTVDFWQLTL